MEITNENYNIYMPRSLINDNYEYFIQDNYFIVNKRTNCYSQYNTTYCDCVRVYPNFNYIVSDVYSCSINNNMNKIDKSYISNDLFSLHNLSNIFIVYFIIIFIFTFILKLFLNIFRKRTV